MEPQYSNAEEFLAYLKKRSNWGRWGDDEDRGAINLVTEEKRVAAAKLVRSGRSVSLSRPLSAEPGGPNQRPMLHWMRRDSRDGIGIGFDFIGIDFHGRVTTHIDALSHYWGETGMYNGRDPDKELTLDGAQWGSIETWGEGIITKGVLLDIPRYRGAPYVVVDKQVGGQELEDVARAQGVTIEPGDAVAVYTGREAHARATADVPYHGTATEPVPGLNPTCAQFFRENDVAVLVWDYLDARPGLFGKGLTNHMCIPAFGMALLDNALLEPLSEACAEEGRYEFMLTIAPLRVPGGTGSPVNPIALF
jgi:kynurenine formamidase